MRYKVDANGYVCAVAFGSYLDNCIEYTGEVPAGYNSLDEWATYSCIQAYYIDPNGNLVLDYSRKTEIENRQEQEAIDYSPVLRKDLYGTDEVLDSQYVRQTEKGKVILLEDIKTIAPRLKITGINPLEYNKLSIYTQGKNMMPCNAVSTNIKGVTFTKNASGSLTVLGTATEHIEYTIADGNATPIFALKGNQDYYLNLGGLQCELRYYDGETTAQQYTGASGLLNLPQNIEVTQVVIKITSGDSVNTTFYPQLECGNKFTSYVTHKCKALDIDFSEYVSEIIVPSDTLYPEDTLYPGLKYNTIDYILIENGKITISENSVVRVLGIGSVGLFSAYSTIYCTKDVELEIEYSLNKIDVDSLAFLQGKSTTTNQFKILEDGSIEAHNGYFSGKIEATSGSFKGEITSESGKIGGFNIGKSAMYTGSKSTFNSIIDGVYVGTDGIAVGTESSGVKIASDGEVSIKGNGSIEFEKGSSGTYNRMSLDSDGIKFGTNTSYNTTITREKIQIDDVLLKRDSVKISSGTSYCETTYNNIHMYSNYSNYWNLGVDSFSFNVSGGFAFKDGTTTVMNLLKTRGLYGGSLATLGQTSGKISFFGSATGDTKKTVSNITTPSSASASTIATKLNELLTALRSYNLIG